LIGHNIQYMVVLIRDDSPHTREEEHQWVIDTEKGTFKPPLYNTTKLLLGVKEDLPRKIGSSEQQRIQMASEFALTFHKPRQVFTRSGSDY